VPDRLRHPTQPAATLGKLLGLAPELPAVGGGWQSYRLPENAWRTIETTCGENRTRLWGEHGGPGGTWVEQQDGTAMDLRDGIEDAIGWYLGWSPDGQRPARLNRARLVEGGRRIVTAAHRLRLVLTAVPRLGATRAVVKAAERDYLRSKLTHTGSGSWIAWDALPAILAAVEDAAADMVTQLPPVSSGPWSDDAFKDLVVRLMLLYDWWTGTPATLSREWAGNRSENPCDYEGGFAQVLECIIAAVPVLARRRGLFDVAARHLRWVRDFEASRKSSAPRD
jgi:hypothetical protein